MGQTLTLQVNCGLGSLFVVLLWQFSQTHDLNVDMNLYLLSLPVQRLKRSSGSQGNKSLKTETRNMFTNLYCTPTYVLVLRLFFCRNKHLCGMFRSEFYTLTEYCVHGISIKEKNDYHEWIFNWRGESPLWISASYWTRARLVDKPL